MRNLKVQKREPQKIKRIDSRIEKIKNPHLSNEYIWGFSEQFIKIRANLDSNEDTWIVSIYQNKKQLKNDNPCNVFEQRTLNRAINCADRYADRCNLTKQEYVTPV